MMNSKKPVDCILHLLESCKEAFQNLTKANVYIVDTTLQYFVSGGNSGIYSRHYRQVSCSGSPNGVILAVYGAPEEYTNPAYADTEFGSKVIFSPGLISVPVFGPNEQLLLTLQVETTVNN